MGDGCKLGQNLHAQATYLNLYLEKRMVLELNLPSPSLEALGLMPDSAVGVI